MMEAPGVLPRPPPHPALAALRVVFVGLLAVHVFISAWLVASVDAVYTEGRPAPTEIHSLVAIDKDRTAIDVSVERATSLVLYTLSRDSSAVVEQDSEDQDERSEASSEPSSQRDYLAIGRGMVTWSLIGLVLAEAISITRRRGTTGLRVSMFSAAMVAVFVAFPACYVLSLSDGGEISENAPGNDLEGSAFVHTQSESSTHLRWLGVEIQASFSGYDLGLVDQEKRANVTAAVPEPGSDEASSFIAFESTFAVNYGKNMDALLLVPFVWWAFPSPKKNVSTEEE